MKKVLFFIFIKLATLFFNVGIPYLFLTNAIQCYAPVFNMYTFLYADVKYFPAHAGDSGRAWLIKQKLVQYTKCEAYQRKGRVTFCNMFARDVLDNRFPWALGKVYGFLFDDFDYDTSAVFPIMGYIYMSIREAYHRAEKAGERMWIKSLTCEQAQARANIGRLVWIISAKYNHEALVCPGQWSSEYGCMVAQAGWENGIFRISDWQVFGQNWCDPEIKFYEFPERN